MKHALTILLDQALRPVAGEHAGGLRHAGLEQARDERNGHYACNAAMQLAGKLKRRPADIARDIAAELSGAALIERVEVAGPGFINLWLDPAALQAELEAILAAGETYGCCDLGAGRKVLVEFVSANPTGPLHVGHGRHAAIGDCLARLLEATGHEVWREYYVNDAGRQLEVLALSVWLRMVEQAGGQEPFPEGAYQGDYINELAERMARELPEAGEAARQGGSAEETAPLGRKASRLPGGRGRPPPQESPSFLPERTPSPQESRLPGSPPGRGWRQPGPPDRRAYSRHP